MERIPTRIRLLTDRHARRSRTVLQALYTSTPRQPFALAQPAVPTPIVAVTTRQPRACHGPRAQPVLSSLEPARPALGHVSRVNLGPFDWTAVTASQHVWPAPLAARAVQQDRSKSAVVGRRLAVVLLAVSTNIS